MTAPQAPASGFSNSDFVLALLAALALLAIWFPPEMLQNVLPSGNRVLHSVVVVAVYGVLRVLFGALNRRQAAASARATPVASDADPHLHAVPNLPITVAYATQSGKAEEYARLTAGSLRAGGLAVDVIEVSQIDDARFAQSQRMLFVASTHGEGDAPDDAEAFARRYLSASVPLTHMSYAVLALGDRGYTHFCGFGKRLDRWLRDQGATPLFDRIEVDSGDVGALRRWQHNLIQIAGKPDIPDWEPPRYDDWRLVGREHLNPGSPGDPCFHITLQPWEGATPAWEAGDIAEVGPRNAADDVSALLTATTHDDGETFSRNGRIETLADVVGSHILPSVDEADGLTANQLVAILKPLPHRAYSIASLPADGTLQLVVRQMRRPDGSLGLGSGWLTDYAPLGARISLRVRTNKNFHPPTDDRPMILVGNGTGLAGLRALIKARIAAGHRRNWLIFGERTQAHDFHFRAEIEAWQAEGWLTRVDLAFSRDQPERVYVQHRVIEAADTLRTWVHDGAAIYVCGSQEGMAQGVDTALVDVLGPATLSELTTQGRYRRDVY